LHVYEHILGLIVKALQKSTEQAVTILLPPTRLVILCRRKLDGFEMTYSDRPPFFKQMGGNTVLKLFPLTQVFQSH